MSLLVSQCDPRRLYWLINIGSPCCILLGDFTACLPCYMFKFCFQDAVLLARAEEEPETAARKLTETAFTRGSADNITCIVARFHHDKADPANPQASAWLDFLILLQVQIYWQFGWFNFEICMCLMATVHISRRQFVYSLLSVS